MSSGEDLFNDDLALVDACIAGQPEACAAFEAKFNAPLRNILVARKASPAMAEDLVRDLLSDCLMGRSGKEPLLHSFHRKGTLKSWLTKCAIRLFIDRIREAALQETKRPDLPRPDNPRQSEAALTALLRRALGTGLAACPAESRLMLQLVYIEGLTQREICRMWNYQEWTVSRQFKDAMETIKTTTLAELKQQDPHLVLEWEDYLELCEASRWCLPW